MFGKSEHFPIYDPKNEVTYVLWSDRKLSEQEAVGYLRVALSMMKKKQRPKKGGRLDLMMTF